MLNSRRKKKHTNSPPPKSIKRKSLLKAANGHSTETPREDDKAPAQKQCTTGVIVKLNS